VTKPQRSVLIPALLAVLLAGTLFLCPRAHSQADPALGSQQTLDAMLTERLMQHAFSALAGPTTPDDAQVAVSTQLVDMALRISPDDAEAWRTRMELAELAQDERQYDAALKAYIRAAPEDDAAQLKLIMRRVDKAQELEGRIEMIEKVLNAPSAERLSEPLRSRLATSAAIYASELGQDQRQFALLRQAVNLDPANPTATTLTYRYAVEHDATPLQRGALLAAVIKSAPMDAAARLSFAYALSDQAAYHRAAQQFQVAAMLSASPLSVEEYRRWALCHAAAGEDKDLEQLLGDMAVYLGELDTPQPMPIQMELVALAALDTPEESAQALQVFDRIAKLVAADAGDSPEAAEVTEQHARLAAIAAVFGVAMDRIEALLADVPADNATGKVARGWQLLRQGQADEAGKLFADIADAQPMARLGLAVLAGDDEAGNNRALLDMVHGDATHIVALLAARELRRLGRDVPATGVGQSLTEQMDRAPNDLWRMRLDQLRWVDVRLRIKPLRMKYAEPVDLELTIRNRSQLPLSMGQGGTLPTQAALVVRATVEGKPLPPVDLAIVDVGRRLTLRPGQALTVRTRLSRSTLAPLIDRHAFEPLSFGTTAIVGPIALPSGALVAGPLGGADRTAVNQVWGVPATPENINRWSKDLGSNDPAQRYRAAALLAQVGSAALGASADDAALGTVGDQLNKQFRDWTTKQRAWMVLFLPPIEDANHPIRPSLDIAKRSDDPLLRIPYLLTQIRDPQDPAIDAGLRHDGRAIRDFASAYQSLLRGRLRTQPQPEPEQDPAPQPQPEG